MSPILGKLSVPSILEVQEYSANAGITQNDLKRFTQYYTGEEIGEKLIGDSFNPPTENLKKTWNAAACTLGNQNFQNLKTRKVTALKRILVATGYAHEVKLFKFDSRRKYQPVVVIDGAQFDLVIWHRRGRLLTFQKNISQIQDALLY